MPLSVSLSLYIYIYIYIYISVAIASFEVDSLLLRRFGVPRERAASASHHTGL